MAHAAPSLAPTSGAEDIYRDKPDSYFGNARDDIVAMLQPGSSVLEVGCGSGGTGRAALAAGKASHYVGIELSEGAAAAARPGLSEVLVGDVEGLDLSRLSGKFDAVIASEVLEHLRDPWSVVPRLAACLKPGGRFYASSPNVSHWRVIRELLAGRFRYAPVGVMDQTHLRWFTPQSYRELFEAAGLIVESVGPLARTGWKAKLIGGLSAGRLSHLFAVQIMVVARRP
ncbi:MAG: class I SAM-dependent methyltransferase [Phenylobacterium sp.]